MLNTAERPIFPSIEEVKYREVKGMKIGYCDDGNPNAPRVILNNFGFGAGSGGGNRRLSMALGGEVEGSRGMRDLRSNIPNVAQKIENKVESLAGKYRIITPQSPEAGLTLDKLAGVFGDLMEDLGVDKYGVFGSSAGGIVATMLAAKRQNNVTGLFLQGTMTKRTDMDPISYWALRVATLPPIEEVILKTPPVAEAIRVGLIFSTKNDFDFNLADEIGKKQMIEDLENADVFSAIKAAESIGQNLWPYIKEVKAPVVALDGSSARMVKIEKIREILKRFHRKYPTLKDKAVNRKVLPYEIGGPLGIHGHTVLNTFPELMAVMIDRAIEYFDVK